MTEVAGRALSALYEIVHRIGTAADASEGAAGLLDVFSSQLDMGSGVVAFAQPCGIRPAVVAASGKESFTIPEEAAFDGNAPLVLLRSGRSALQYERLAGRGAPPRGEIALLCAPVPGGGARIPCVAVDRLFGDGVDPSEDLRLLAAAASLLSPLFQQEAPREAAPLGRVLQEQIAAWVEPMEVTRKVTRSDLYDRLVGEVEKILIDAALKKTGYVQSEAARFLGINRNTLSKKAGRYGLRKRDG